jgi:hypothetical protein
MGIAHINGGQLHNLTVELYRVHQCLGLGHKRNLGGRKLGRAHIDRDPIQIINAQFNNAAGGFHAQHIFTRESALAHKARKTTRAIAALLHLGAICIKNAIAKIDIGGFWRLYHQQLVKPHAEMTVGELADLLWSQPQALADQINHHEIVAEAVHLGELQTHCGLPIR